MHWMLLIELNLIWTQKIHLKLIWLHCIRNYFFSNIKKWGYPCVSEIYKIILHRAALFLSTRLDLIETLPLPRKNQLGKINSPHKISFVFFLPHYEKKITSITLHLDNLDRVLRICSSCLFVQCVCHCHSVELSTDDAGMEDCSLPISWKHCGAQTCTGKELKFITKMHIGMAYSTLTIYTLKQYIQKKTVYLFFIFYSAFYSRSHLWLLSSLLN